MGGLHNISGFGFALSFKLIKPLHRPRDQQQVTVRRSATDAQLSPVPMAAARDRRLRILGGLLLGAILTGRAYRAPPAGAQRSEVLNRVLRGGELHGHHQVLPSRQRAERSRRLIGVPATPPRTSWTLYAATPPRAAEILRVFEDSGALGYGWTGARHCRT